MAAPDSSRLAGPPVTAAAFDAFYYKHCCGKEYVRDDEWLEVFGRIADRIVADIAPRRVLDAGCALGFLVEALRARDTEAFGIDLSAFAIDRVHETIKPFCRLGSITGDLGGPYDLIVSIEVLEHMQVREAEAAIANICAQTTDVLFSSSPYDYREPTHVNVHPTEYWAELFARQQFFRDVDYDASYIVPWAIRFRKRDEPVARLVREYERRHWALLAEAIDARAYSTEVQRRLAEVEEKWGWLRAEYAQPEELVREVEQLRQQLRAQNEKLAQAVDTIRHMERSRFWQLRLAWQQVKRVFGTRPGP